MSINKEQTSQEMSEQARKEFAILADAQKNGYLHEIKLDSYDKRLIEERQTTLEKRIAEKEEERNQTYLKMRKVMGNLYTKPNKENFAIGNWSKEKYDNYTLRASCSDKTLSPEEQLENKKELAKKMEKMAYLQTSHLQAIPDWKFKQTDVVHTDISSKAAYAPFAYNFQEQTIFVHEGNLKNALTDPYKPLAEAAKGNSIALDCITYHELNHKQNWESDGLGLLSYTPINAAKGAILTEKISYCTEYLVCAKEYAEHKAKGDTTIKYNDGTEKPLDSVLDMYPGLKETVEKYGANISNPETKKAIVNAAMNDWQTNRGKDYTEPSQAPGYNYIPSQTATEAAYGNHFFSQCSFSKQMELLKNEEETYKQVSTAMLSDINIAGEKIDLKDCKDLIDTHTTEDVKQLIAQHNEKDEKNTQQISLPTYQEYQEINQHLESIGKTTDAEKMAHIAQTVQAASSITSYDKTLENIIISHNSQIIVDEIKYEKVDNSIIADFHNQKYDITEYVTVAEKENSKQTILAQNQSSR